MFGIFEPMETVEVDGCVLHWEVLAESAELTVGSADARPGDGRGHACVQLDVAAHHLRIRLKFSPIGKAVDVSIQPSLFEHLLPVGPGPCQRGTVGSAVAHWVAELAGAAHVWRPNNPDTLGLVGTAGGVAFPLLGAAYDRGATALGDIPRWATPILREPTPRAGAGTAFGEKATRVVVAALASTLVGEPQGVSTGEPVNLYRLSLALMGAQVLEPDRIARLLQVAGPRHPPDAWPTMSEIAAGRQLVGRIASARAERLLTDAAERPDGLQLLADILRASGSVLDLLPARPAHRLEDLRNQCLSLLPIDPDPQPRGALGRSSPVSQQRRSPGDAAARVEPAGTDAPSGPARPARARPRRSPRDERRTRALLAPTAAGPSTIASGALPRPMDLSGLDRCEVGDRLRIVVPRSTDELAAWGRRLHSCIGTYGAAVASGRSLLLGVELADVLSYCIELTPTGAIRQFLGYRNRAVPTGSARAVCERLVEVGVVDPTLAINRVWLEG